MLRKLPRSLVRLHLAFTPNGERQSGGEINVLNNKILRTFLKQGVTRLPFPLLAFLSPHTFAS